MPYRLRFRCIQSYLVEKRTTGPTMQGLSKDMHDSTTCDPRRAKGALQEQSQPTVHLLVLLSASQDLVVRV